MTFNAARKMPDVYFREIEVPGSIAGAATAVVGIVGPASKGPINEPVNVTNFARFEDEFGPHLTAPRFFGSYAAQGFFANGGQHLWYVRVSNGASASENLMDQSGAEATISVTAREEGVAGNAHTVSVDASNPGLGTTTAIKAATTLTADVLAGDTEIPVATAVNFAPGDVLLLDDGGGTTETVTINRVVGNNAFLTVGLTNGFSTGNSVRIANLTTGTTSTVRVASSSGFESGSYVLIDNGVDKETAVVDAVEDTNHILTLRGALTKTYSLDAADPAVDVTTLEFDLTVTPGGGAPTTYAQLSMDPRHSRYFLHTVDDPTVSLAGIEANPSPPPDNLPLDAANIPLTGGLPDIPATLTAAEFTAAIDALQRVPDVTMVCVPDRTDLAVQAHLVAHCEEMADRFAILDPAAGLDIGGIKAQRGALQSDRGYAAIYYPRIYIAEGDDRILVPTSGHLAGVFARTDDLKGVHKAPANEAIRGALDLELTLTEVEAGDLNEESVNVLRFIRNRGHRIWGARTISAGTQWRYVNVRRLILFIEESVREAIRLHIFKPNNKPLWKTIKRQVDGFLTQVWKDGALYGAAPEEGFQTFVNESLNPPTQIALGILTVEVRLRPNPPAEFIVFRIIQSASTSLTEEQ